MIRESESFCDFSFNLASQNESIRFEPCARSKQSETPMLPYLAHQRINQLRIMGLRFAYSL